MEKVDHMFDVISKQLAKICIKPSLKIIIKKIYQIFDDFLHYSHTQAICTIWLHVTKLAIPKHPSFFMYLCELYIFNGSEQEFGGYWLNQICVH